MDTAIRYIRRIVRGRIFDDVSLRQYSLGQPVNRSGHRDDLDGFQVGKNVCALLFVGVDTDLGGDVRNSTPDSRRFINGLLDKLSEILKEEGKMVKTGRGLIDS